MSRKIGSLSLREAQQIVEENTELFEHADRPNTLRPDHIRLVCRIDVLVDSVLVTLDHDTIEKMGLHVRERERDQQFDPPTTEQFTWKNQFSNYWNSEGDEPNHRELQIEYAMEMMASELYEMCARGFWTEPVRGYRHERREPIGPTVTEWTEEQSIEDLDATCDFAERSYEVGTKRYSVAGVID